MSTDTADPDRDLEDRDGDAATLHRCECGFASPSMDRFVDHVSDEHHALDVAVQALHAETVEVIDDVE